MNMRQRRAARKTGRDLVKDAKRDNPDATWEQIQEIAEAEANELGLDPEMVMFIIEAILAFIKQLMELRKE